MADSDKFQRLSYSGTNIDIPYLVDSLEMGDLDHIIHKTKSGGTIIYTRGEKEEWDVDCICTESEADTTLRSWIENRYTVLFYPNFTDAPGTSHNTKIINRGFPFRRWGQDRWRAMLKLRKVT
jgi:hypothetical protein